MAKRNKRKVTCLQCGHVWVPRKGKPKSCAKCKTKYWNVQPEERTDDTLQGRPKIVIPKESFERLCQMQATLVEISEFFGISEDTVERWCKEQYEGRTFKEVFTIKRALGLVSLRRTLFQQSVTTPSVAIFLAKNWLGMSDKNDVDLSGSIVVMGTGYPSPKEDEDGV